MKVEKFSFGQIIIDGKIYNEDIIIINHNNKSKLLLRNKQPSRKYKHKFGHTPLTVYENIDWSVNTIIIGTGIYGSLPVTSEFINEARHRNIKLHIFKTHDALNFINTKNACIILHITC